MPWAENHEGDQTPPATGSATCPDVLELLQPYALDAANFLKALGHEGRLMILCHLSSGPKSVTELENLLASRQAAVSQQLARLRLEGQAIFYSILDPKVEQMVSVLAEMFCPEEMRTGVRTKG